MASEKLGSLSGLTIAQKKLEFQQTCEEYLES